MIADPTKTFAQRVSSIRPSAIREILKVTQRPEVISFAGGLPAAELFPTREIGEIAQDIMQKIGTSALQYAVTEGILPLREWVAQRMRSVWGVEANAADVVITGGSQQGLDLVGKTYLDPGDYVAIEAPSYLGAIQAFDAYQARYLTIETDDQGLIPDALERALAEAVIKPKFLYLIPNFQNPTGISLAAERREPVVRICERFGIPIFEDDPYGELRFSGDTQRPLASFPSKTPIFYAGTGSKIMAPGLRVAWLIIRNAEIRSHFVTFKQAGDLHTGTLAQYIFAEFASDEQRFQAHVHRICMTYGERQRAMVAALRDAFGERMHFVVPDGGMFLWTRLDGFSDVDALFARASAANVVFVPGRYFYADHAPSDGMRLSFSSTSPEVIREGVARLKAAVDG